jgi:hypothetical protein
MLLSLFDVFVIIPSYLFALSCQLISAHNCPEMLAYLPSMVVMFDLVESLTHLHACVYYPQQIPSPEWLLVASAATQFKFLFLGLSLVLSAYFGVANTRSSKNKEEEQQQDKQEATLSTSNTKAKQT